jgi:hypothetical protein
LQDFPPQLIWDGGLPQGVRNTNGGTGCAARVNGIKYDDSWIKLPGVDRISSVEQGNGGVAEIGGNIPVDKTTKPVRPAPS